MEAGSRKVYDTSQLAPSLQFPYWRESICEAFAALDPVPQRGAGPAFGSRVELDAIGGINISLVQSQVQCVDRRAAEIRRDARDRLFINLMLRGWSTVSQGSAQTVVHAGEAYVVDTTRPYRLDHPVPFRLLCLDVPRDTLMGRATRGPALAEARSMSYGRAALALGLLRQLRRDDGSLGREEREEALGVALRWLRAALEDHSGPSHGAASFEPAGAVQLWRRAMDCIEQRIREPSLGPADIAAELKVSISYLHKVFALRGCTVAGTLRELRLQRCAEALASASGRRKIAAIASDWGFGDVPNFNRQFKRRFGHAPGEHRR